MLKSELLTQVVDSYESWIDRIKQDGAQRMKDDDGLEGRIFRLHRFNLALWDNEDEARRTDLDDAVLVGTKRESHRLYQARNDAIERIDEWLLDNAYGHLIDRDLPMRTETPGAALDRLSILSLKVYHMARQIEREGVTEAHRHTCNLKLTVLKAQHADLKTALLDMIGDLNAGNIRMKVYRQFKMYNEPNLNPRLYRSGKSDLTAEGGQYNAPDP